MAVGGGERQGLGDAGLLVLADGELDFHPVRPLALVLAAGLLEAGLGLGQVVVLEPALGIVEQEAGLRLAAPGRAQLGGALGVQEQEQIGIPWMLAEQLLEDGEGLGALIGQDVTLGQEFPDHEVAGHVAGGFLEDGDGLGGLAPGQEHLPP